MLCHPETFQIHPNTSNEICCGMVFSQGSGCLPFQMGQGWLDSSCFHSQQVVTGCCDAESQAAQRTMGSPSQPLGRTWDLDQRMAVAVPWVDSNIDYYTKQSWCDIKHGSSLFEFSLALSTKLDDQKSPSTTAAPEIVHNRPTSNSFQPTAVHFSLQVISFGDFIMDLGSMTQLSTPSRSARWRSRRST